MVELESEVLRVGISKIPGANWRITMNDKGTINRNNLKTLDIDEHLRPTFRKIHDTLLDFCEVYNLTLDLATSDNVMWLEDSSGNSICLG